MPAMVVKEDPSAMDRPQVLGESEGRRGEASRESAGKRGERQREQEGGRERQGTLAPIMKVSFLRISARV